MCVDWIVFNYGCSFVFTHLLNILSISVSDEGGSWQNHCRSKDSSDKIMASSGSSVCKRKRRSKCVWFSLTWWIPMSKILPSVLKCWRPDSSCASLMATCNELQLPSECPPNCSHRWNFLCKVSKNLLLVRFVIQAEAVTWPGLQLFSKQFGCAFIKSIIMDLLWISSSFWTCRGCW